MSKENSEEFTDEDWRTLREGVKEGLSNYWQLVKERPFAIIATALIPLMLTECFGDTTANIEIDEEDLVEALGAQSPQTCEVSQQFYAAVSGEMTVGSRVLVIRDPDGHCELLLGQ